MDDPGLDPGLHRAALAGLARINVLSFAWIGLAHELRAAHRRLGRPVRVVDVAGGGGDVLTRAVVASGVPVRPLLADVSELAIEVALDRARRRGIALDVVRCDALAGALPPGDLVACSLFLHHLDRDQAVGLLGRMRAATGVGVFVNDLRWSRLGTALARVVPRLVTRSAVVHTDALLSAKAAWTVEELQFMADSAGLDGVVVRRAFPSRMELSWSRPA